MPASRRLRVIAAASHPRAAVFSLLIGLLAVPSVSGCSLLSPESTYTIHVDSLTVSPSGAAGEVLVRAHGMASGDGCGGLDQVERRTVGDTLVRRFVGKRTQRFDVSCTLIPLLLNEVEELAIPTSRVVRYVVRQPDGTSLIRDIPSP